MGEAAGPLSLAATGFKAFGSISDGYSKAANVEAKGQDSFMSAMLSSGDSNIAASAADLKATQTDTFMRDQLGSALGTILAVQTGAGVGTSPTDAAVRNRVQQQGDDARVQRVANIRAEAARDRMQGMMQMWAGQRALSESQAAADQYRTGGWLSGAGSIFSGLSGAVGPTEEFFGKAKSLFGQSGVFGY